MKECPIRLLARAMQTGMHDLGPNDLYPIDFRCIGEECAWWTQKWSGETGCQVVHENCALVFLAKEVAQDPARFQTGVRPS